MPRLAKSTTVAAFTVSTPPPLPRQSLSPFLRFWIPARSLVMIPLPSHLVARSMAPLGRPLVSPLHRTIRRMHNSICSEIFYRIWNGSRHVLLSQQQRFLLSRPCSPRSVWYIPQPRLIVHYRPSFILQDPFPLWLRSRGGGGGVQGQQGRPLLQEHTNLAYSARLRRASCNPNHEGDRSWGAPYSWGAFVEGAPTAVGDQDYLGPYHGEYYYPSDSYRPHTFEQQPPPFQDSVGADCDPSFPYSGGLFGPRGHR